MDAGGILLWEGGPSLAGTPAPTALFFVDGAKPDDHLPSGGGQSFFLADLTGDGLDELVAVAYRAREYQIQDAGAIYVWSGAPSHVGGVPASGRLTVPPGLVVPDSLGFSSVQALQLGDVTGDGLLDVVVNHRLATVDGVLEAGAVHVWSK